MSGGGSGCYRNANIDETDILVGQLGHASWTTRMLYASPPVTDNQPGSAEQPQGRLGVLLSAQCTLYKGHVSQDFTLCTGLTPIKVALCVCTKSGSTQHSTAQCSCRQYVPIKRAPRISATGKRKNWSEVYYFDHHLMQMIINNVGHQHDQVLVQTIAMIQSRESTRPSIVAVFTGGGHWQWHLPDLAILSNARLVFSWVQAWCN